MTQQQNLQLLRETWPRRQPRQRKQISREQIHRRPEQAPLPRPPANAPNLTSRGEQRATEEFANPTRCCRTTRTSSRWRCSADERRPLRRPGDTGRLPLRRGGICAAEEIRRDNDRESPLLGDRTRHGGLWQLRLDAAAATRRSPSRCGRYTRTGSTHGRRRASHKDTSRPAGACRRPARAGSQVADARPRADGRYGGERPRPAIPDYALDMHTRRGRQVGRGLYPRCAAAAPMPICQTARAGVLTGSRAGVILATGHHDGKRPWTRRRRTVSAA
jgi:hypothetical protein